MTDAVRVACAQLRLREGDKEGDLATAERAVREAAGLGARIVVLPELASTGYTFHSVAALRAEAEPLDGPTITGWRALAAELDVILVAGFAEVGEDGGLWNSAVIVDGSGVLAAYRKAHLWNAEKLVFSAGTAHPPVIETRYGRLGLMICYDLEFPEWVRLPALAGADLLCAPVAWPAGPRPTTERPGEIVRVQADASVNRMAIAACDRVGPESGADWVGGTVIVDADGYPVTPIRLGEEHLVVADLPLSASRDKRISERNDVHADRRPELYRGLETALT
jgi:predicted amidohydrolase